MPSARKRAAICSNSGQVTALEKSTIAIFYKSYDKQVEREDGEEGTETRRVLKAYAVFNADQCDGLPEMYRARHELEPVEPVAAMFASIRPGGEVHIADYAHQSGALMRALFRLTVQAIDGLADTQPNADGALESILSDYDEAAVAPQAVVPTATGAISLFKAIRPIQNNCDTFAERA